MGFLLDRSWYGSFIAKLQSDIWKQLPYPISETDPNNICLGICVVFGELFWAKIFFVPVSII